MIADKEVLAAARILRDYCGERRCSERGRIDYAEIDF